MTGRATRQWDIGAPEPDGVTHVHDLITGVDELESTSHWGKTYSGEWKGYKGGGKVYLDWPELVRRWGPVAEADKCP